MTTPPKTVPFAYYLHDTDEYDGMVEWIAKQTGVPKNHPCFEDLGRPFYEVGLECELDTETGEIRILGVKA